MWEHRKPQSKSRLRKRLESEALDGVISQLFTGFPDNSPLRNLFADPDNDSRSTLEEIATGTDPFSPGRMKPADDSSPHFSMAEDSSQILNFTLPNPVPELLYRIESSTTLGETESWHRVAPEASHVIHRTATHSTIQMKFAPMPEGMKEFFRMVFEIPR